MVTSSVEPMLNTPPGARSHMAKRSNASTVSVTWPKQRDCWPLPNTRSGSPALAASTKRGSTIPYRPVCRGPTVLKIRATMTGNWRSAWKASARNSSINFEQA